MLDICIFFIFSVDWRDFFILILAVDIITINLWLLILLLLDLFWHISIAILIINYILWIFYKLLLLLSLLNILLLLLLLIIVMFFSTIISPFLILWWIYLLLCLIIFFLLLLFTTCAILFTLTLITARNSILIILLVIYIRLLIHLWHKGIHHVIKKLLLHINIQIISLLKLIWYLIPSWLSTILLWLVLETHIYAIIF